MTAVSPLADSCHVRTRDKTRLRGCSNDQSDSELNKQTHKQTRKQITNKYTVQLFNNYEWRNCHMHFLYIAMTLCHFRCWPFISGVVQCTADVPLTWQYWKPVAPTLLVVTLEPHVLHVTRPCWFW